MLRPKILPFQLELRVNECHFGLPQLWAIIQFTLSMQILYTRNRLLTMHIDKVKKESLLTTVASRNGINSLLVYAEKGKFWVLTMSHKMCPRKQTTEPKLVILVSFCSGEVTSYTGTSLILHLHIVGSMPLHFFWATLYSAFLVWDTTQSA